MSLRIAINAQLVPGSGVGGVQTVLTGLVNALAQLNGPEQYVLVGPWEEPDWLKPYIGENQCIVRGPKVQAIKRMLRCVTPLVKIGRQASSWISGTGKGWPRLAQSNGFFEGLGCDIVHFPYQHFVLSRLPAVFNPHDLQHAHFPHFFSATELQWREATYGDACRTADVVIVHCEWTKKDVVRHYDIQPNKIQVIPWPPPTQAYLEPTPAILEAVSRKYQLSSKFALYPAMTWEHKNHLRLLEALALLRDRDRLRVELVCTGHQDGFFRHIRRRLNELRLEDQVRFLKMVPSEEIRALYRLAQFLVFPSLFEGAGVPLVEAFAEGTPVTCAAVTSMPELAGDAALLFNPMSVEGIAEAVSKIATDTFLRETLKKRGFARLENFKWETTAKTYRAVYRRAAGCRLTDEDQWLLSRGEA